MKNKRNTLSNYLEGIKTKHVFLENEQVFLKKESDLSTHEETEAIEWFPTDFNWVSTVF